MAIIRYTYQNPQTTIATNNVNEPYVNLQDGTDGTVGRIDTANVRAEGMNRNHLDDYSINSNFVINNTDINATFNSVTYVDAKVVPTGDPVLQPGDVYRCGFNPQITATTQAGINNSTRATAVFYLRITLTLNTGGADFEVAITPPMGHGIIGSLAGFGATDTLLSAFYERATISGIYIPRTATTVKEINLSVRIEENIHSFTLGKCQSWGLVARN
tara:strand:- start:9273 stop:9920 length:648 start_codon:yes stop_codon:yes gene_type:complete